MYPVLTNTYWLGCDFVEKYDENSFVMSKISMMNEFYPLNRTYRFQKRRVVRQESFFTSLHVFPGARVDATGDVQRPQGSSRDLITLLPVLVGRFPVTSNTTGKCRWLKSSAPSVCNSTRRQRGRVEAVSFIAATNFPVRLFVWRKGRH